MDVNKANAASLTERMPQPLSWPQLLLFSVAVTLSPMGARAETETMAVSKDSCLTDYTYVGGLVTTKHCWATCDGLVPKGGSACRVADWYRTNLLSKGAGEHKREGAYPHASGSLVRGDERNIRTGSDTAYNQIQGCNLLRAQECLIYMRNYPPKDCVLRSVVAEKQPQCCPAYEPAARCIRDVGCGHHEMITDLFTQCKHHECVMGCEFSRAAGLIPTLGLAAAWAAVALLSSSGCW